MSGGEDISRYTYLQQSLSGQFVLGRGFRLDGSVEHYFNDAVSGSHRHLVFADLSFGWLHKRMEFRLEARNLFNHKTFNYISSNNLIDISTMSPLRGASVVLKVRFSIL